MNSQAINAYGATHAHSAITDASPHKLISLLFQGAIDRIQQAKGAMARGDIAKRGQLVGKALDIVNNLQACLDKEKGGEVAKNLDALYDYMQRQLLKANMENDPAILDEVTRLLTEVQSGWDAIDTSTL